MPTNENANIISLTKGVAAVSLSKAQPVSLDKSQFDRLAIGLKWTENKGKPQKSQESGGNVWTRLVNVFTSDEQPVINNTGNYDLDLSAITFDANNKPLDVLFYGTRPKNIYNGAITHSGDDLVGGGNADNETIIVNLNKLPKEVTKIAFALTSYQGQSFENITDSYLNLYDVSNGKEKLAYFDVNNGSTDKDTEEKRKSRCYFPCVLIKTSSGWNFEVKSMFYDKVTKASGINYRDMMSFIQENI